MLTTTKKKEGDGREQLGVVCLPLAVHEKILPGAHHQESATDPKRVAFEGAVAVVVPVVVLAVVVAGADSAVALRLCVLVRPKETEKVLKVLNNMGYY